MYVTALISVGSEQVTAIPVDAVVQSEGKNYILLWMKKVKQQRKKKTGNKEI